MERIDFSSGIGESAPMIIAGYNGNGTPPRISKKYVLFFIYPFKKIILLK